MDAARRRLLGRASAWAALGWIYGCDAFEGEGAVVETGAEPELVPLPEAAAERMRRERRHGVVIVVPRAEAEREALGAALGAAMLQTEGGLMFQYALRSTEGALWLATLQEFIVSCVPESAVPSANARAVLLVSPEGAPITDATYRTSSADAFVRDVRRVCDADPFAAGRRAAVRPLALDETLQLLAREHFFPVQRTGDDLERELARRLELVAETLPATVALLDDPSSRSAANLSAALQRLAPSGHAEHTAGKPTIHGVRWEYEAYDPCPPCGMVYVPSEKRIFDAFLLDE